jgi:hypothetical protein
MSSRLLRSLPLMGAVAVAFSPLSLPGAAEATTATAACPTCCSQSGSTCVICGSVSCTAVPDYYEGKVGPGACSIQVT